jgi:hypothetical protein
VSDVFLFREWPEPLNIQVLKDMVEDSLGCFGLHRVEWHESFLSIDRTRMLCHFIAPDAESVRIALRQLNADMRVHWPGSVHDAPGIAVEEIHAANVIVFRSFAEPVLLTDLQALEDGNIQCLETHRVRFMRTFFSTDQCRMACLYQAPDAESVRIAQRQAGMPLDQVIGVRRLSPESLA